MLTLKYKHIAFGASLITLISATPALAQGIEDGQVQPAGSASALGMGEIVVTARRTDERLRDVPISITVFNQEQLAKRNIVSTTDLSTYTPSLQTNNLFGSTKTLFSIRGFVQENGTPPSVGVYFADVIAPRAVSIFVPVGNGAGPGSLFDLQNVQVLKGPQGTLFGRNTTGGTLLIVPQKPTESMGGYIEGSIGNYAMKRFQAVVNAPLSDTVRVRLGADRMKRKGYVKNTGGIGSKRFNDIDYLALRASIVVDLAPNLENYTVGSFSRSNTAGDTQKLIYCQLPAGALACGQLARANAAGDGFYTARTAFNDNFLLTKQWQIVNTTTWNASDSLTVKNIASYGRFKEFFSSESFGYQFDTHDVVPPYPVGTFIPFTAIFPAPGLPTASEETWTNEFRLSGDTIDKRLTWQAGAYAEISNPVGKIGTYVPTFATCSNPAALICNNPIGFASLTRQGGKFKYRNYGLYAQATYSLTQQFKVTAGARYTWDRSSGVYESFRDNYATGPQQQAPVLTACKDPALPLSSGCITRPSSRSSKPTWLLGLDYKPSDNLLLYAKYSRGYRAGGFTPGAPNRFVDYLPEKLDAYEIGIKTNWRGAVPGSLDISTFYNDLTDQQLQVTFVPKPGFVLPPIIGIINAGKSRVKGIEAAASLSPLEGLRFDAAYTYLDAKLRSIAVIPDDPTSPYTYAAAARSGDTLSFSPKNKLTLTGTYTLPVSQSVGDIELSATYVYSDGYITNYAARDPDGSLGQYAAVPSFDLLNLNLDWNAVAGSPVDLSLFVTNVTKTKYYTSYSPWPASLGFYSASFGEPRIFGARVRVNFGS